MDILEGGVDKVRKMLPKVINARTHGTVVSMTNWDSTTAALTGN